MQHLPVTIHIFTNTRKGEYHYGKQHIYNY